MKKFLLMFAAVAAIAFVGCKTETKPAEETTPQEEQVTDEYTVEGVTDQLMNAADEAGALKILDDLKAKATEFLNAKDNDKYFNIMNIVTTVWEKCKDQLTQKFPGLAEKINDYITVPDEMKDAFAAFQKTAAEKVGDAVEGAVEAAGEKVEDAANAVGDKAKEVVEDAKAGAAEGLEKAAEEIKK